MYYTMFLFHILLHNIKFCLSCYHLNIYRLRFTKERVTYTEAQFLEYFGFSSNLKELCDIYQRFHYIIHSFVSQMFGAFFTGIQIFWKISKSEILLESTIFSLFLNG